MLIKKGDKNLLVLDLQKRLNAAFRSMGTPATLSEDGIYGAITAGAVRVMYGGDGNSINASAILHIGDDVMRVVGRSAPWGVLSATTYTASTFGGPDDEYDRMYGQAYLMECPTPRDILKRMPDLTAAGLFRREALGLDAYPEGMGLSWALDADHACYCAIPWCGEGLRTYGRIGDRAARVAIMLPDYSRAAVAYLTDHGPASSTGCTIDLSPAIAKHLGIGYRGRVLVTWADDVSPVGFYG